MDFMDYDPDFAYDGTEDSDHGDPQEVVEEYDALGNPLFLATAAGMGYHMTRDEFEEQKLSEEMAEIRDKESNETEKVPLSSRHSDGGKGNPSPFMRWAIGVARGTKKTSDPIEYTKEEQRAILEAEAEDWVG